MGKYTAGQDLQEMINDGHDRSVVVDYRNQGDSTERPFKLQKACVSSEWRPGLLGSFPAQIGKVQMLWPFILNLTDILTNMCYFGDDDI